MDINAHIYTKPQEMHSSKKTKEEKKEKETNKNLPRQNNKNYESEYSIYYHS